MDRNKPTPAVAAALMLAFDHFNADLFDAKLPAPMFVWQRNKRSRGHFHGDVWKDRAANSCADEISLNPDLMEERSEKEILSTLVHEMCHQRQHHFGKPSRNGYHNKEWAGMMREVGLEPSSTAAPGGKDTGQKVSHYIVKGGRFCASYEMLTGAGWRFPWSSVDTRQPPKPSKSSKVKFTCPECEANAWGAPSLRIVCSDCDERMKSAADL